MFFKYSFYSRVPVLLVLSYIKLKLRLLLSLGQCSSRGQFVWFGVVFGFLIDVGENLLSVEFSGILGLVEFGGILRLVEFGGILV